MKKKIAIRSKKIKEHLNNGGRPDAKKDFWELLKRSVLTDNKKN